MRTRILRMFCKTKCRDVLCVQQSPTRQDLDDAYHLNRLRPEFAVGLEVAPVGKNWEPIKDFELDDMDKATAFAIDASLSVRHTLELAMFEDGKRCPVNEK